jgi:glycosyltransferase 2 family protein
VTALLLTAGFGRVIEILARAEPLPLLAAASLFCFGTVLSASRWRLVVGARNADPPSTRFLTGIMLVGMFFNFFLPSTVGGDVVRAELTKNLVHGRIESYSSVLFDRFIAFISVLLISFSAAIVARLHLGWFKPYILSVWLFFLLGGAGFVLTVMWFPTRRVLKWAGGGPINTFCGWLDHAQSALQSYMTDFSLMRRVLLLAIAVQVTDLILAVWLLAKALQIDVPFVFHLIAVPIIELVALVPVSFNGVGLREGAYIFFYGGASVVPEAAIALSFAYTTLLLIFGLLGGICWLWPTLYGGSGIK